jgi:uncharacterized membrane protein
MNQNTLIVIGIALIFLGIIAIIAASSIGTTKSSTKFAVGGVIGFIPFGFGNDKQLMIIMFIIMVALMIIFYTINFLR